MSTINNKWATMANNEIEVSRSISKKSAVCKIKLMNVNKMLILSISIMILFILLLIDLTFVIKLSHLIIQLKPLIELRAN